MNIKKKIFTFAAVGLFSLNAHALYSVSEGLMISGKIIVNTPDVNLNYIYFAGRDPISSQLQVTKTKIADNTLAFSILTSSEAYGWFMLDHTLDLGLQYDYVTCNIHKAGEPTPHITQTQKASYDCIESGDPNGDDYTITVTKHEN